MTPSIPNADQTSLDQLCNAFKSTKILVVGDIMLDRFVYGHVERISPESPVPVLVREREEMMLGGAGNALANLVGLETQASIICVVGDDEDAKTLETLTKNLGVETKGFVTQKNRPTSVKTRFLAGHQQLLRTDSEDKSQITGKTAQDLLSKVEKQLDQAGVLLLSDYGKGLLQPATIKALIDKARARGVPVLVDPKGQDFSVYAGADIITPNRKELGEAAKSMPTKTDEEVAAAGQHILDTCGVNAVLATRSSDGMSIIKQGQAPVHVRPKGSVEVFDVSGAGDTVIATIAACLAAGASLEKAAEMANLAGSIVVTKVGTAPIRLRELQAAVQEGSKIADLCDLPEACEQVKRWKARGLKVGVTNGCFDILHAGHTQYLAETKQYCDKLIVALNRDSSVRILKGPERPVHGEVSRAAVLSALASVDMVVLFGAQKEGDDNTACAVLEALKPDLYFKGGDYTIDQIPEAPTVMTYGGQVHVLSELKGHSTTNALAKIKGEAA